MTVAGSTSELRVLALEPYDGGSHRAFLAGWCDASRHAWTICGLRPAKWKWRMRHAAVTFADELSARVARGEGWDVLFCSDMLNLAEFRGLAPPAVRQLPSVAYFHENQLTYPVRVAQERDFHFAMTNMTTALAADAVWFNSAYNRDAFLDALLGLLRRMPDHQPLDAVERIRAKSSVVAPGLEAFPERSASPPPPLHIIWAARWEHDKDPEGFFAALELLAGRGVDFRLSVVGEQFERSPAVFEAAQRRFAAQIDRWGYQPSRAAYRAALAAAHVFVSTARHEFFGISAAEAIAAGAYPLLPDRLAYPELLENIGLSSPAAHLYDGSREQLAMRLEALAREIEDVTQWHAATVERQRCCRSLSWMQRAATMDLLLNIVAGRT
jgi:glycosyltransferase involved in cell wall biosynthesis